MGTWVRDQWGGLVNMDYAESLRLHDDKEIGYAELVVRMNSGEECVLGITSNGKGPDILYQMKSELEFRLIGGGIVNIQQAVRDYDLIEDIAREARMFAEEKIGGTL